MKSKFTKHNNNPFLSKKLLKIFPIFIISNILLMYPYLFNIYKYNYKYSNNNLIKFLENAFNDIFFSIEFYIFIIIIYYYIYLFSFYNIFKLSFNIKRYNIQYSLVEQIYSSPLFCLICLYLCKDINFKNIIDFIFANLIATLFFIQTVFLIYFSKHTKFTNVKNEIKILIFFNVINFLTTFITYKLIYFSNNSGTRSIILGKGIYIFFKILEIFDMRFINYYFIKASMENKDKYIIMRYKFIMYFVLSTKYVLSCTIIFNHNIYNNFILGFMLLNNIDSANYLAHFEYKKEFYRMIVETFDDVNYEKKDNVICQICKNPLIKGKRIKCNHEFHTFCIAYLFNKLRNTCPICNKEIYIYDWTFEKFLKNIIKIRNKNIHIASKITSTFKLYLDIKFKNCQD